MSMSRLACPEPEPRRMRSRSRLRLRRQVSSQTSTFAGFVMGSPHSTHGRVANGCVSRYSRRRRSLSSWMYSGFRWRHSRTAPAWQGRHQLSMPFRLFGFGLKASIRSHCRQEQHHFPLIGVASSSRAFVPRVTGRGSLPLQIRRLACPPLLISESIESGRQQVLPHRSEAPPPRAAGRPTARHHASVKSNRDRLR